MSARSWEAWAVWPPPNLTRTDAAARAELLAVQGYDLQLDVTDGAGHPGAAHVPVDHDRRVHLPSAGRRHLHRPDRRHRALGHAQRHRARREQPTPRTAGCRCPGWPSRTPSWSRPTAGTPTPARACTASTTPRTGRSTSTRSSSRPTPSGCSPASTSPTSRPRSRCTSTAPFDWQVVSNTGGRDDRGRPGGSQLVHFEPTKRISTYLVALIAGPYAKVTDSHEGIPLGLYCRASLAQHLDADELFRGHQAGLRLLPRGLRLPVPVRQVRPAVRPRVQRRGHGERRRGHLPGGLRLPVEGEPGRGTSGAPRRSCTSWRTCGSATW